MRELYGVYITGLWGRGNFRALAELATPGAHEQREWSGRYDDTHLRGRDLIVVTHSFGTDPGIELCHQLAPQRIALLLILDGVHLDDGLHGKHEPFETPPNVVLPWSFHRDEVGDWEFPPCTRLADERFNQYLGIPHAAFPFDPTVIKWLTTAVQRIQSET